MTKFYRHIPNGLSALRLLAAPVIAVLIVGGYDHFALGVFLCAGLSDALDGYLAKTFSLTSRFGAMLDPTADKLLMVASYLALSYVGGVPWWLTAVVIGRDVAIVSGIAMAKAINAPLKIAPLIAGKVSTVVQVLYVALVLLLRVVGLQELNLQQIGELLVVTCAAWSLGAYGWVWIKAVAIGGARVG